MQNSDGETKKSSNLKPPLGSLPHLDTAQKPSFVDNTVAIVAMVSHVRLPMERRSSIRMCQAKAELPLLSTVLDRRSVGKSCSTIPVKL